MEFVTETYPTPKGPVEGVLVKWSDFSILMVCGSKGFFACPAIDTIACQSFGKACALVESSSDNPIGTLQRFCKRKLTSINEHGKSLGLKEGMIAEDAFELIA